MDDLSKPQALVPLWTKQIGNRVLDQLSVRPVLIDVETLHTTIYGEITQLCSTWARILPVDPFFLWKNTNISVRFRFEDIPYTLCGLASVTNSDNSFHFEFDLVSRELMQVLSVQLKDAGILRSDEVQAIARQQEEQLATPSDDQHEPGEAKQDTVKHSSGDTNRRVHARYGLATPANLRITNGGDVYRCAVIDLSLGGCRVQTAKPLNFPVLTRVEVQFVGLGLPLILPAQIQIKIGDHVAGLKYLEVSPHIRERLSVLLEELTLKGAPRE